MYIFAIAVIVSEICTKGAIYGATDVFSCWVMASARCRRWSSSCRHYDLSSAIL